MSAEHETFIKTPKQLITIVVLSFVLPVLFIVLLVKWVGTGKTAGAGAEVMTEAAILERIRPVAGFQLGEPEGGAQIAMASPAVAAPAAPAEPRSGEEVYNAACMACHATGAAGAPKYGDAEAWAPRIAQGYETLHSHSLNGLGAMPPQGGGAFSDLEVGRAVVYMANAAGGDLPQPE
jgi:cytochrome c5